jgi:hypothetical protein
MIRVLLHPRNNNTNSREERATTLSTEGIERERDKKQHIEKRKEL